MMELIEITPMTPDWLSTAGGQNGEFSGTYSYNTSTGNLASQQVRSQNAPIRRCVRDAPYN